VEQPGHAYVLSLGRNSLRCHRKGVIIDGCHYLLPPTSKKFTWASVYNVQSTASANENKSFVLYVSR